MKYLALSALLVASLNVYANSYDESAHVRAIKAVLTSLSDPQSELGKADAKIKTSSAPGVLPDLERVVDPNSSDLGSEEALTLIRTVSPSEIDSVVLVRIVYSSGGTPTINSSITVKVSVVLVTDPNNGEIRDSESSVKIMPESVTINSMP